MINNVKLKSLNAKVTKGRSLKILVVLMIVCSLSFNQIQSVKNLASQSPKEKRKQTLHNDAGNQLRAHSIEENFSIDKLVGKVKTVLDSFMESLHYNTTIIKFWSAE